MLCSVQGRQYIFASLLNRVQGLNVAAIEVFTPFSFSPFLSLWKLPEIIKSHTLLILEVSFQCCLVPLPWNLGEAVHGSESVTERYLLNLWTGNYIERASISMESHVHFKSVISLIYMSKTNSLKISTTCHEAFLDLSNSKFLLTAMEQVSWDGFTKSLSYKLDNILGDKP